MSGMFGGGKNVSTSSPIISSLRLQTSSKGRAIPLVFGKNRIAPNMLDYQDFTAIPHTETQSSGGKGGGGGSYSNTTYTYTTCLLMSLCEGPISGVTRIWKDKNQYVSSNPCGELGLSLYLGNYTQSSFGYMQTKHPERALAYRGLAYVAAGAYDLGDSATIPNHSFEVDAGNGYSATIRDANPHAILTQLLTNARYGAGFPASKLADWTHYSQYCIANNLFLSPVYTDAESAHNLLLNTLKITNTGIYFSEGKLKLKPYGDAVATANGVTWNPNLVPVYDLVDDHFLELPRIIRSSNADAFNQVQVKFFNRNNDYNEEVIEAKDQANIELFGLRPAPEFNAKEIADPAVARTVAQLLLQRSLYIRNVYEFRLGWRFALLEPMDIVTITDAALGLDRQPVRITEIEEDDYGELTIRAEEMPLGVCSAALYPYQNSAAYSHNYNVSSGNCLTPAIIELESSSYQPNYEIALGIATAGLDPNWGGCEVWISFDGASYSKIGEITTAARYGRLATALNSAATGIAASVVLNTSKTLISSSNENAQRNSTLSIIDDELVSYTAATLAATSSYNLTLKNRGDYGTTAATHPVNSRFVRLDDAVFWTGIDFDQRGSTVYIKLPSFNLYRGGLQSLGDVNAIAHVIAGKYPDAVADFTASAGYDHVLLKWALIKDKSVTGYEIREGTDWSTASLIKKVKANESSISVSAKYIGYKYWLIRAFNSSGTYSDTDSQAGFFVRAPSINEVHAVVSGNGVHLYWSSVEGTFRIATYLIKKGADFATAVAIGTKDGLFTNTLELSNGIYRYWIVPIDAAGNVGVIDAASAWVGGITYREITGGISIAWSAIANITNYQLLVTWNTHGSRYSVPTSREVVNSTLPSSQLSYNINSLTNFGRGYFVINITAISSGGLRTERSIETEDFIL